MQKAIHIILLLSSLLSLPLLQGCATAASGAASGVALATDRRDSDTIIDDQYIEVKATHAITNHQALWKQSHINVYSYNNVLLLVGQTPSENLKREAEQEVKNIPKVRQIHNELTIGPPASLSTRSKDSWITAQIKGKLVGSKDISAAHIKVITEGGIVYLMGITTHAEEVAATEIARAISGVDKVVQIFERLN
jgi:osmotically-inducible protein OsmY